MIDLSEQMISGKETRSRVRSQQHALRRTWAACCIRDKLRTCFNLTSDHPRLSTLSKKNLPSAGCDSTKRHSLMERIQLKSTAAYEKESLWQVPLRKYSQQVTTTSTSYYQDYLHRRNPLGRLTSANASQMASLFY